jgi:hypothetical protein
LNEQQTPIQEAISLITIVAIIIGVGCFAACLRNVPVNSPTLFSVAELIYQWCPALNAIRSPQVPMLVASAAVGGIVWLLGLPFAGVLAMAFSAGQMAGLEKQTLKLKKNRAKVQQKKRDRDGFEVR